MNKQTITAIAAAISIAFSAGVMAGNITKSDYKAGQARITAEFKSDKANCKTLSGNANDVCMAEANGKSNVANAELDASYKPTAKSQYKIVSARADSDYAIAKEKCDDSAGNAKDVCLKEAKAAKITAMADAKAKVETTAADNKASEESSEARGDADKKATVARNDAASKKRDANYAVAKEKCDALAGDAKDSCINDAKQKFGE